MTKKVAGAGSSSSTTTTYGYSRARSGYHNVGRLTDVAIAGRHAVAYDYHMLGGVASEEHSLDGRTYRMRTSYLPNGAVDEVHLPTVASGNDGGNSPYGAYSYDAAGRPTRFGAHVTSIAYDLRGQPTRIGFASGAVEERPRDPARGWLTRVRVSKGGDDRLDLRLERAVSGRITAQDDDWTQARTAYTYDYAGRILRAANTASYPQHTRAYTYASDGSIRSRATGTGAAVPYSYPGPNEPHPHAPTRVGPAGAPGLVYDANGNMTRGLGGRTMIYDAENRLIEVTHDGIRTRYGYGADGSRFKRTEAPTAGGSGETTLTIGPIEVRDYGGPRQSLVVYPDPSVRIEGSETAYLHTDHLGSLRLVTSPTGATLERRAYLAYGEPIGLSTNTLPQEDHAWIGERYDAGAELMFLNGVVARRPPGIHIGSPAA